MGRAELERELLPCLTLSKVMSRKTPPGPPMTSAPLLFGRIWERLGIAAVLAELLKYRVPRLAVTIYNPIIRNACVNAEPCAARRSGSTLRGRAAPSFLEGALNKAGLLSAKR